MKLDLQLDYATVLANQARPVHCALLFTAPVVPVTARRPGAFCLVLDRSGSMGGEPLAQTITAARTAIRNLQREDYFALVAFDDSASVVVPLQTPEDRASWLTRLETIKEGGSTNLTGGWMLGRDELAKAPAGMSRRLLLLTDGQLNVGVVVPEEVERIVAHGLEDLGIRTTCLGFGQDYNDALLAALARATSGGFYHAESPEQLPAIFAHELDGLQALAVQNLRVRVRVLDFCERFQLLNDYPNVALPDGRMEVAVGDLVSGEERRLVFALEVLPMPLLDGQPVASLAGETLIELEVAYDELGLEGIASRVLTQVVRVQASQNPDEVKANATVIGWVAVQRAAQTIRQAAELLAAGNRSGAIELLKAELARVSTGGHEPATAQAATDLAKALQRIGEATGGADSSKQLRFYSFSSSRSSSRSVPPGGDQA